MRVAGIDLSLTGTGVALVGEGPPGLHTFGAAGKKTDTLHQRYLRIKKLSQEVIEVVASFSPDLVVVESPSFASKGGHPHDRSGLWWLVVAILSGRFPMLEVAPKIRMKYATGNGNAAKEVVALAVVRRHPGIEIKNNNEADALILAYIGRRLAGKPVEETLPKEHLEAMKTLVLPEGFHAEDQA